MSGTVMEIMFCQILPIHTRQRRIPAVAIIVMTHITHHLIIILIIRRNPTPEIMLSYKTVIRRENDMDMNVKREDLQFKHQTIPLRLVQMNLPYRPSLTKGMNIRLLRI